MIYLPNGYYLPLSARKIVRSPRLEEDEDTVVGDGPSHTSISLVGPISFRRLLGSTGTAGTTSVLSAPILCFINGKNIRAII